MSKTINNPNLPTIEVSQQQFKQIKDSLIINRDNKPLSFDNIVNYVPLYLYRICTILKDIANVQYIATIGINRKNNSFNIENIRILKHNTFGIL